MGGAGNHGFSSKCLSKCLSRPRPIDYDRGRSRKALHLRENCLSDEFYNWLYTQLLLDQKLHTNDCREATTQWYLLHRYCSKGFLFTVVSSLPRVVRSLTSSECRDMIKNSLKKLQYIGFVVSKSGDRLVMFLRVSDNGIASKKLRGFFLAEKKTRRSV